MKTIYEFLKGKCPVNADNTVYGEYETTWR